MVTFAFANGAMAQSWTSDEWPAAPGRWTSEYLVVGSLGMVEVELRGTLRINRGAGWETLFTHPEIGLDPPTVELAYPYADQLRDFVGAIEQGRVRRWTAPSRVARSRWRWPRIARRRPARRYGPDPQLDGPTRSYGGSGSRGRRYGVIGISCASARPLALSAVLIISPIAGETRHSPRLSAIGSSTVSPGSSTSDMPVLIAGL